MLIENVLPHCINPACKISLLKAVVFSKKKKKKKKNCAWLSLCSLYFHFGGIICLLFSENERVRPDKL